MAKIRQNKQIKDIDLRLHKFDYSIEERPSDLTNGMRPSDGLRISDLNNLELNEDIDFNEVIVINQATPLSIINTENNQYNINTRSSHANEFFKSIKVPENT